MRAKKILSLFLTGLICLTSIPFTVVSAEETEEIVIWDGTVDTSWYNSSKEEFYISTAEELAGLAKLVTDRNTMMGKTIYLKNDIYLNDVSNFANWGTDPPKNHFENIGYHGGNCDQYFWGNFYGQGHTIYGLYARRNYTAGLFGAISERSVVSGVNLMYSYTHYTSYYNDGSYAGSICQINYGTITDCTVYGTIISGNLASTEIYGCIGGICGSNAGTISRCRMSGSISCDSNKSIFVGGISGTNGGTISECSNYANITALATSADCFVHVGGISGTLGAAGATIENCYNRGTIYAENSLDSEYYGGGIAGFADESVGVECSVGGIVGCISTYKQSGSSLKNVYNTGYKPLDGKIIGYSNYSGYYSYRPTIENYYFINVSEITYGDSRKSEAEMKTASFAETLGEAFVYVEGDFPKLAWEVEATAAVKGDINNDGTLNVTDLVILQKYLLNAYSMSLDEWNRSDLCVDGSVDVFDLCILKRMLMTQS